MNRRYVCLQHEEFRNGHRSAFLKIRDSVLQGSLNSFPFMHQGIPGDKGGGMTSGRETAYYVVTLRRCENGLHAGRVQRMDIPVVIQQPKENCYAVMPQLYDGVKYRAQSS
jgi:hypothetical protein